jgi:HK97 family phage major capsid protein
MTETNPLKAKAEAVEKLKDQLLGELNKHFEDRDTQLAERLTDQFETQFNELRADIAKANPSYNVPGAEPTGDPKKDFSIARACLAIARRDWSGAGVEKEVFEETRRMQEKAMSVGSGSAGGYVVPENYIPDVIEYLYNNTAAFKLGATTFQAGAGSPIHIPRVSAGATAAWIASEGTSITASDLTLAQLELTPKTLGAYVIMSNLLLENSTPVADQLVRMDLQNQLAVGLDTGILAGSGASGQPTGIQNTAGINTHDFATATATYDALVDFCHQLSIDNALKGSLGWAMNPVVLNDIMTMTDATNQPLERRVLAEGAASTLLGFPYEVTNSLPTTEGSLIFGNWSEVFVPVWKGLELRASDTTGSAFQSDQFHVRAIMRADVGVRHAVSFCSALNYAA